MVLVVRLPVSLYHPGLTSGCVFPRVACRHFAAWQGRRIRCWPAFVALHLTPPRGSKDPPPSRSHGGLTLARSIPYHPAGLYP